MHLNQKQVCKQASKQASKSLLCGAAYGMELSYGSKLHGARRVACISESGPNGGTQDSDCVIAVQKACGQQRGLLHWLEAWDLVHTVHTRQQGVCYTGSRPGTWYTRCTHGALVFHQQSMAHNGTFLLFHPGPGWASRLAWMSGQCNSEQVLMRMLPKTDTPPVTPG